MNNLIMITMMLFFIVSIVVVVVVVVAVAAVSVSISCQRYHYLAEKHNSHACNPLSDDITIYYVILVVILSLLL